MALTRDFKATVQGRVQADPAFRDALLHESIETLLGGDVDTGKAILRDYIKATVGFEKLGAETGSSAKSLIRMFGPTGNPQARNLFAVLKQLQKHAGLTLRVIPEPRQDQENSPLTRCGLTSSFRSTSLFRLRDVQFLR